METKLETISKYVWWYYFSKKGNTMNENTKLDTSTPKQDNSEVPAFLKRNTSPDGIEVERVQGEAEVGSPDTKTLH